MLHGSQALLTVSTIVGIISAIFGVLYLRKQTVMNATEHRQKAIDKAVTEATAPLREQIAAKDQVIASRDRVIEQRNIRIEYLEDELRRGPSRGGR